MGPASCTEEQFKGTGLSFCAAARALVYSDAGLFRARAAKPVNKKRIVGEGSGHLTQVEGGPKMHL